MFTIKATYRGQTRKATFLGAGTFPPHSELVAQIRRVFPVPDSFYLSKLLFSPDALAPSRVLIAKEVHSLHDYNKCIRAFKDRKWHNAQLRFTICDEVNPSLPSHDTPVSGAHREWPSSRTSHSSINFAMDIDSAPSLSREQSNAQHSRPTPQHDASTSSMTCCSVSDGKAEIRAMLSDFQDNLNRILENNLDVPLSATPQASVASLHPGVNAGVGDVTSAPPPSWCSMCTRDITAPQDGQGAWYSCADCHVVVCKNCHERGKPSFCLSVMGPHHMKLMSGQKFDLPIPRLPAPWRNLSFSVPNAPFIPAPILTPNVSENPSPDNSRSIGAPQAVIHTGVVCDVCNNTVEGVRHKCLDCRDYDLCTACITSGSAEAHNPFHEFLEIKEPGRVIVHTVFSGNGEREATSGPSRTEATPSTDSVVPAAHLATCDLCDSRIVGARYKCLTCPDFDACASCFSITDEQHPSHPFVKMSKKDDYIRGRATARPMHYATCDGCKKTIYGARFKCMHPECPDYDLCQNCEAHPIPVHPSNHPMLKMKTPDTVVPTVYRVGQQDIIPQEDERSTQVQTPIPVAMGQAATKDVPTQSVSPEPMPPVPFVYFDSRPQTPAQEERAKTPTPTTQVNMDRPPVPPKPEMMYASPWASEIPRFFDSYYPQSEENVASIKATPSNPFADIVVANPTPVVPVRVPASPKPVDTLNPWPTTNPAERQELLELIAGFSGSSTSDKVLSSISSTKVEKQPTQQNGMSERASLLERLAFGLQVPTEAPIPMSDSPTPMEKEKAPLAESATAMAPSSNWTSISHDMDHLLQNLHHNVSVLQEHFGGPKQAPSVTESTLSKEALLNPPKKDIVDETSISEGFSVRQSLASLINDLPSLVPTKSPSPALPESASESRVPLSAAFLEDVTVADGQIFPPGAEFVKCWRLLNDSGRDWPESTELVFLAGDSLAANSTAAKQSLTVEVGKVTAGKEVDVWTGELKAPDAPGRYVGYWRLKADGDLFGNSLWIEINVAEADSQHSSDESMASSSIIMPTVSSAPQSHHVSSVTVTTLSAQSTSIASRSEDNLSDAGSDISLISMPSSPSDDEDDVMWHDTRSHTTSELTAAAAALAQTTAPNGSAASPSAAASMDYVLLYDDQSSEDE